MEIFKPYHLIEQSPDRLHLKESAKRRVFLFVFFRIFPVLLFISILSTAVLFDFPPFYRTVLILLCFLPVSIIRQKYITDMYLTPSVVKISYQTFAGSVTKTVDMEDVEAITLESYYFNPGGGDFYRLKLKGINKQVTLFTIPFLNMKIENREKIKKVLQELTGLVIQRY